MEREPFNTSFLAFKLRFQLWGWGWFLDFKLSRSQTGVEEVLLSQLAGQAAKCTGWLVPHMGYETGTQEPCILWLGLLLACSETEDQSLCLCFASHSLPPRDRSLWGRDFLLLWVRVQCKCDPGSCMGVAVSPPPGRTHTLHP